MKLATLKTSARDGKLLVVRKDLQRAVAVPEIAQTLQQVLDNWSETAPKLTKIYDQLNRGEISDFPFESNKVTSPLPRAYQWADGSAYLHHVDLVRRARGAQMPPEFLHDPLMYQGGSDAFLGPEENIQVADINWGIDFEAEVSVITDDVPMGITPNQAEDKVRLIMLVNDISLRNLIPQELNKGFGFFQSKPSSAFSPVAVTPDELEDAWFGGKVHLPLYTYLNNKIFGQPNAGHDMQFNFYQLIAHAAKTRSLNAGTIIGSGTVSNKDESVGSSCLAEVRMLEIIKKGKAITEFMQYGDIVKIEMLNKQKENIFGTIKQKVVPYVSD